MHSFSLKPFPTTVASPRFEITGVVERRFNELSIDYEISGDPAELIFAAPSPVPLRKRGLWEETCFEFFLAPKEADHYWEFNLSPAGHWNVYSFTSYRKGMREEPAIASLPFTVAVHSHGLRVSMKLDLAGVVSADRALKVAVSAVVKAKNTGTTYWASIHTGPKPDFHRHDNFVIEF